MMASSAIRVSGGLPADRGHSPRHGANRHEQSPRGQTIQGVIHGRAFNAAIKGWQQVSSGKFVFGLASRDGRRHRQDTHFELGHGRYTDTQTDEVALPPL